jgi:glutaminyl-tRNA synthetase
VWEYSRLNITNTVMSKRKLNRLVTEGHVKGWDDPRLLTLAGLRRRGVTPGAINSFCREIGITRNANVVPYHKLEHHVRAHLDAASPRALAVLRPLKVILTNLPEGKACAEATARRFPGRGEAEAEAAAKAAGYKGDAYAVPVSRVVYIESTDFREEDARGYYGLAPGKTAMLRYAFPITVTGVQKERKGGGEGKGGGAGGGAAIAAVLAEADLAFAERAAAAAADPSLPKVKPPKGVLNWVAQPAPGQDPPTCEVRLYGPLFRSEAPEAATGGGADAWLADLDQGSCEVLTGCMLTPELARDAASALRLEEAVEEEEDEEEEQGGGKGAAAGGAKSKAVLSAPPGQKRYQWERLGYFCVDPDSRGEGSLVFNRTATLREAAAAKKV